MNRINTLFGIEYPIVQGGMVWCSGWRLASAVSNAGGLGLLGAGSMHPETLREHIRKCRQATDKPFGITVVHVVSSSKFARKCEEAGVDAIVAEGFEAGGHNGREETTTLCLIPAVRRVTSLPLIAAGGIATGAGMLAAMTLGAEGAQIGTRFAFAAESSAHENFKNRCLSLEEGDTMLMLKKVSPTRLVKGGFFREVEEAENRGATAEELKTLLGKGRAKKGMFEGDLDNGELEIGQVASLFREQQTAAEIVHDIVTEYRNLLNESKEKLSI